MLIYEIFDTAKMETYNDETWFWKVFVNNICIKSVRGLFSRSPSLTIGKYNLQPKSLGGKGLTGVWCLTHFFILLHNVWKPVIWCCLHNIWKKIHFSLNPFSAKYLSISSVNIVSSSNMYYYKYHVICCIVHLI